MSDLVDVAPLREAFLRSGLTQGDVARRLGWVDRNGTQGYRVARSLGLLPWYTRRNGRRYVRPVARIQYDRAVALADAIGVSPVDVGL